MSLWGHSLSNCSAILQVSEASSYVLQESEFLCLEFDEVKVKQVLKRLSEVEESIGMLMQAA